MPPAREVSIHAPVRRDGARGRWLEHDVFVTRAREGAGRRRPRRVIRVLIHAPVKARPFTPIQRAKEFRSRAREGADNRQVGSLDQYSRGFDPRAREERDASHKWIAFDVERFRSTHPYEGAVSRLLTAFTLGVSIHAVRRDASSPDASNKFEVPIHAPVKAQYAPLDGRTHDELPFRSTAPMKARRPSTSAVARRQRGFDPRREGATG